MDHWGGMGWIWIPWFVLLFAAAIGVLWAVMAASRGSDKEPRSPEEILKARYARGEIDREEYERRLADLRR